MKFSAKLSVRFVRRGKRDARKSKDTCPTRAKHGFRPTRERIAMTDRRDNSVHRTGSVTTVIKDETTSGLDRDRRVHSMGVPENRDFHDLAGMVHKKNCAVVLIDPTELERRCRGDTAAHQQEGREERGAAKRNNHLS
ncbi:MAG: hypothetical protein ACP5O6_09045 [Candidatus Baltobacteraceae bacterium]